MGSSETLRGQFLIAGKSLRDPNFFKSVVLVVEHNDQGAIGLVVNHPTPVNIAEALGEHMEVPATEEVIYVGGPVSSTALFILHNSHVLDPDAAKVSQGIFLGSHPNVFEDAVSHHLSGEDSGKTKKLAFRVFCGCAGWGPGQLEEELARADWLIQPASEDDVFFRVPHEMWESLYQNAMRTESLVPHLPGDPDLN
ncbi:MAG: YqgE/AlgH family protein [Pirellulales bacterium]|nr:YqgE/AlgH family protein [Pirellulales bacterium]